MPFILHDTPLGTARLTETDGFISAISILDSRPESSTTETSPVLKLAAQQLYEYFAGKRQVFDFPMKQAGTPFQQTVWDELATIGYGKTMSYGRLSHQMNSPLAIRAIASANGKNNLWIVVPCHRVLGADGSLTGYAGGLWRKQWLLAHEAEVCGIGQVSIAF